MLALAVGVGAVAAEAVAAQAGSGDAAAPGDTAGVSPARPPAEPPAVPPSSPPAEASADSVAGADTMTVAPAALVPRPAREPREVRTAPAPKRLDQPRWVMLRSLLVPGWGQAHNRAWLKAALVAAGDGALRWRFVRDELRLGDLNRDANRQLGDLTSALADTAAAGAEYREALASGDPQRIAEAEAALNAANVRLRGASDQYNETVSLFNALLDRSINRRWILGGVVLYALIDAYVDAHFRRFDIDFQFDPALPGGPPDPGARLRLRWTF